MSEAISGPGGGGVPTLPATVPDKRARLSGPALRLSRSIRTRGLANSARLAIRWGAWRFLPAISTRLEVWLPDLSERRFDRRYGTETRSRRGRVVGDAPAGSREAGKAYEATTPGALRLLVRSVTDRPGDWTFVDVGSGKGKALMLAAGLGFQEVIGVEHSPSMARQAEANVRAYRQHRGSAPRIRTIAADATTFGFPDSPLFIYLFNPFGESTLRAFAANLQRSLAEHPRPVALVYLNPVHHDVLDECGFLDKTAVIETFFQGSCFVYRHAPQDDS